MAPKRRWYEEREWKEAKATAKASGLYAWRYTIKHTTRRGEKRTIKGVYVGVELPALLVDDPNATTKLAFPTKL